MQIGPYTVLEHSETVSPHRFVVFWTPNGKTERAKHLGRHGGFQTWSAAAEAVEKTVKYGTTNV